MDFKKITKRVNWGLKGAFYELVGRELEKITNSWENKQDSEKVSTLLWYGLCTVVIIIVTIIIFIDWLNFFGAGHLLWHSRFFNHFFVDGDNKFNWIGMTSVLAILSLTFTAWDSRRKLRADVVSKSRIQWISEARSIAGNLIGYEQKALAAYRSLLAYNYRKSKTLEEFSKKMKRTLNDNVIDLSKYRNLFLLYFEHQTNGEYTENNLVELANEIKKLSDEISHLVAINEYDYAIDSLVFISGWKARRFHRFSVRGLGRARKESWNSDHGLEHSKAGYSGRPTLRIK
ncbi:hypothetical protein ACN50E_04310, partial [Levilactobacillus brevis]